MKKLNRSYLALLTLAAAMLLDWGLSPASSSAQSGHVDGAVRLDLHLNVGFGGAVGPGMRVDIPLLRDGLISSANDELALTLGGDVLFRTHDHYYDGYHHDHHHRHDHHENGIALIFPVAAQWNFILRHNWTIFPELGVALVSHDDHLDAMLDIAFGARWHFGGGPAALLLRITRPGGFQVGITW